MTTNVPFWRTNIHTKRTTGCRACLPDLETTRPENLPPKEKVISLVQMQKNQTYVQIE